MEDTYIDKIFHYALILTKSLKEYRHNVEANYKPNYDSIGK